MATLFWASVFGFGAGFSLNRFRCRGEAFDLLCFGLTILNLIAMMVEFGRWGDAL
jgi:hypothetical protein